jgi:two-component system, OmpR family, sensor histidine kinase BaeS
VHRPGLRARLDQLIPRSFRARITMTVVALVAGVLLAVSAIVVNRLDAYFAEQEEGALSARALEVGSIVAVVAVPASGAEPVIQAGNTLSAAVAERISSGTFLSFLANAVAKADVTVEIGGATQTASGDVIVTAAPGGTTTAPLTAPPEARESRETLRATATFGPVRSTELAIPWGVRVTLSNPYTTRAYTLTTVTTLLVVTALGALVAALLMGALIAGQFTRPLRRLSEATRQFGGGDLANRVPAAEIGAAYTEVTDLARQFNLMASRLEESVGLVRRDRDRSREFLADVSHELRTPIAALRMNTELLQGQAGDDAATRGEFLESSRVQLERLDWLAQNLLDLSKLESGLLALDLRPDDLRTTVESAVEQADAAARRRGVELALELPDSPLRIRHDPQRIGHVVGNLVGNALKFTPRGGRVRVELRPHRDGAQLDVADTGVGIDAAELPHIFERFYRGSSANEARGTGSGLGLAIVKSIVDMHAGRINVESRVGQGSTFSVVLVRDPRGVAAPAASASTAPTTPSRAPGPDEVANSS